MSALLMVSFVSLYANTTRQTKQYSKEIDSIIKKEILDGHLSIMVDGNKAQFTKLIKSPDGKRYMTGKFRIDVGNNESTTGIATISLDVMAQLQKNDDGFCKYLIPFAINYGGSGTFWHIGLFSVDTKAHNMFLLDKIELQDRVKDISLHIDGEKKWVSYSKDKYEQMRYLTFDDSLKYFTTLIPVHLGNATVDKLKKYSYSSKKFPELPSFRYSNLYILGYSNDGKISYLIRYPYNEAGVIAITTFVQDLTTDKIIWEHSFHSGENPSDDVGFESYWLKNHKMIAKKLKSFNIDISKKVMLKTSNLKYQDDILSYSIKNKIEIKKNQSYIQFSPTVSKSVLYLHSKKYGKKVINKTIFDDNNNFALDMQPVGYFTFDNNEKQIAIVVASVYRGYEGPPHSIRFHLVGAKLNTGFKK